MDTTNPTPGPWTARLNPAADNHVEVVSPTTTIAICGTGREAMANARLIAAAGELLDAVNTTLVVLANMSTVQFARGWDRPARDTLAAAYLAATGTKHAESTQEE